MASNKTRDKIVSLIQQDVFDDPDLNQPILTGVVVIAEFIESNGERILLKITSNRDGDPLPHWTTLGYLHSGMSMLNEIHDDEWDDD